MRGIPQGMTAAEYWMDARDVLLRELERIERELAGAIRPHETTAVKAGEIFRRLRRAGIGKELMT